MFGLALDLLTGRYGATAYNDRDRVEWPPHPARLFSALVATWAEGEPDTDSGRLEQQALEWLERAPPPEVYASAPDDVAVRDVVPVFVPVNDVGVVSPPSREKLDEAYAALALATDAKSKKKAEAAVAKLEAKLRADTARAVAAPARPGKGSAGEKLFAERRTRQPRTFPSLAAPQPTVGFVWPNLDAPSAVLDSLAGLSGRVVRLGHSSTLVHARMLDDASLRALRATTTCFRPDEAQGSYVIRWVAAGQLERLRRAFERHRETEPRVLPAQFFRYSVGDARVEPRVRGSEFDHEFVVLARVGGPRLPITSVAGLARQVRRALMSGCDGAVPALLSGHAVDGPPLEQSHLAVVPLPVVGHRHADGAVLGVGLVLPRGLEAADRREVLAALARLEQRNREDDGEAPVVPIRLGQAGVLELQRVAWGEHPRSTLRPSWWSRPSRCWASATPVALDKNPGDLHDQDPGRRAKAFAEAESTVLAALHRIGLPSPARIDVVRSSVLPGTAKPRTYPRFPSDVRRPQRVLVHVRLQFAEPVRGPILVGAGRYHGLGLFLPVDAEVARGGEVS